MPGHFGNGSPTIHTVRIDDAYTTVVREQGTGPPIVLIHGTPLDARAWDGLIPLLAPARHVVAYDLRGHGSAAGTPTATQEALAHDLSKLLDALAIERVHVLGHSFGGQVAQCFALAYPGRVVELTLVCTRASPFPAFSAAAAELERSGATGDPEPVLSRWFDPQTLAQNPPATQYARSCIRSIDPHVWAFALRSIAGFDVLEKLHDLIGPAKVIAADHDAVAEPEHMEEIAGRIHGAEFHVLAGAWHMVPLQSPERVAHILASA